MRILTAGTTDVSDGMIRGHAAMLAPYAALLQEARSDTSYTRPESALAAPNDEETRRLVRSLTEGRRAHVRTVLLVGIGGSDLGTRAVYDAVRGHLERYAVPATPRLLAFDTIVPRVLGSMGDVIARHERAEDLVLVVVSKSGTTTESLVNANSLFARMVATFGPEAAARQTIVITDAESPLARAAQAQGIDVAPIPKAIGGRYSVFTAVGLVPLALLGLDVDAFLQGGARGAHVSVGGQGGVTPASVLAGTLFDAYSAGLDIHDFFIWNSELATLGAWYRQLLAESIGKESRDGSKVGLTPTVTIGSTDLHSQGQLIYGGPKRRMTTFVASESAWITGVDAAPDSPFAAPGVPPKRAGEVMSALYESVRTTYRQYGLPFVRVELEKIDEAEVGAFMAVHMAMVMYLAKLFSVNAFDQPAVEAYKAEAKRLLGSG